MKIWVDAHISPGVAAWINEKFPYQAQSLTSLGLRDAKDSEIFEAAKVAEVILVSKDSDFLDLIGQFGCPPKLILLRCGNTTNQRLREIFGVHLQYAMNRLADGESVVELE